MYKNDKTLGQAQQLALVTKRSKIALAVGAVFLVVLLVTSVLTTVTSNKKVEAAIYLNQYRLGSKTLTSAVQSYAVTGDEMYREAYETELNVDMNRDKGLAGLEEVGLLESEWDVFNQISALSNGLVPLEEDAMASVAAGDSDAAISYVFGDEYMTTTYEISNLTGQVIDTIEERLDMQADVVYALKIGSAVLFGIAFLYIILQLDKTTKFAKNKLLQPIIDVSREMEILAGGNLHSKLDMEEDDTEVGTMIKSINHMKLSLTAIIGEISGILLEMGQGNFVINTKEEYEGDYVLIKDALEQIAQEMQETIRTIQDATTEISEGSQQLSTAAEGLANSCTEQAGQVSDLLNYLMMMEETISYNEKDAQEAVKISNLSSSTLAAENIKMKELRESFDEINNMAMQIVNVVSTIENIAEETDMLSMNAAIEAARAGEAGRGFAVVSEQVKKLAEESAEAVSRTNGLIDNTTQVLEKGANIVDKTSVNLEEVVMGASETTERIERIVSQIQGELDRMKQINESIAVVAGVVDDNSAISEETAAVSEEQNRQIARLVNLVNSFNI